MKKISVLSTVYNNGAYLVTLTNGSELNISEDIVVEYRLVTGKALDEEEIIKIMKADKISKSANKILNNSRTRKTENEVYKLVIDEVEDEYIAKEVVLKLVKTGFLNDGKFVVDFIHDQLFFKKLSFNSIYKKLRIRGVDISVLDQIFYNEISKDVNVGQNITNLEKYFLKYGEKYYKLNKFEKKQKIYSHLLQKQYTSDEINYTFENYDIPEVEISKAEAELIITKILVKYNTKNYNERMKFMQKILKYNIDPSIIKYYIEKVESQDEEK